jgi:hypothetical protein
MTACLSLCWHAKLLPTWVSRALHAWAGTLARSNSASRVAMPARALVPWKHLAGALTL